MTRYFEPIGSADPNAPYIDDNPAAGQEGSAVPARAIEHPQREIVNVITDAGLEPDENRVDQLSEAIGLMIDLATGGGENPLNDLLNLLRARLKIFPEIQTASGTFNLSQPTGSSVRIPSGIDILHRGVFPLTTAQQDFSHVANKVYHLRYRFTGTPGWSLVDVSDSAYNPSALAEDNPAFDTSYDDMVSHRIVTNGSNVATITPLVNKNMLGRSEVIQVTNTQNSNTLTTTFDVVSANYNWARTPVDFTLHMAKWLAGREVQRFNIGPLGTSAADLFNNPLSFKVTRYNARHTALASHCGAQACFQFAARA